MPLQSSGTINLSDVIEEFGIGTNNSVNVFTTGGATGTVTAPVTGYVIVEMFGGGGGGGGGDGDEGGGSGGSGAYVRELIFIDAGQTLSYSVGAGGDGGFDGATGGPSVVYSGTKSITTIRANGGDGGSRHTLLPTFNGGERSSTTPAANTNLGIMLRGVEGSPGEIGGVLGGPQVTSVWEDDDGNDGYALGGAGGDNGDGDNGNDGVVKFTWFETTKNIRGYLKGANTNVPTFANNTTIPTSGTVELRDFIAASAVGFMDDPLYCDAYVGATFTGTCNVALTIYSNGRYDLDAALGVTGAGSSIDEKLDQQWLTANGVGGFEPRRFYVALFKSAGDSLTLASAPVNTWISMFSDSLAYDAAGKVQGSNTVVWRLAASGSDEYFDGVIKVSTTSSNTGVVAVANVELEARAAGSN